MHSTVAQLIELFLKEQLIETAPHLPGRIMPSSTDARIVSVTASRTGSCPNWLFKANRGGRDSNTHP
jgi:hypothetical protein